jgi:hypothetical protein
MNLVIRDAEKVKESLVSHQAFMLSGKSAKSQVIEADRNAVRTSDQVQMQQLKRIMISMKKDIQVLSAKK